MNKKARILFFSIFFAAIPVVHASEPLILQDENYFLQDELKKARVQLVEKEAMIGRVILQRAEIKDELDAAQKELDILQGKVASLQKTLIERDQGQLRMLKDTSGPFRSRIEELEKDLQVEKFSSEQKAIRIEDLNNTRTVLMGEVEKVSREKREEKTACDGKVKDVQVRLTAEQTLTQEKINQAQQLLQDRIKSLEAEKTALAAQLDALKKAMAQKK